METYFSTVTQEQLEADLKKADFEFYNSIEDSPIVYSPEIAPLIPYYNDIGKKGTKTAMRQGKQAKPFKSGLQVNTIKGVIFHPLLNIPCYTFEEDDSYVECRRVTIL